MTNSITYEDIVELAILEGKRYIDISGRIWREPYTEEEIKQMRKKGV